MVICYSRFSQIGVVSYGSECPSHGVYARVTEAKHWLQYITEGAVDTNCIQEIPFYPGNFTFLFLENNISFCFICVAKLSNINIIISAIIETGGIGSDGDLMAVSPTSAEVILPDGRSCTLPDLPQRRFGHTQSGSENLTAN